MALKLWQNSMPVSYELTNSLDLSWENIVIVQHWVKDAIDFWIYLEKNSNANVLFLPKPFSQNSDDLEYWKNKWLNIKNPWYSYDEWLEKEWYLDSILKSYNEKSLFIIEVWWVFSKVLEENDDYKSKIKWIVEITTFGHNRHLQSKTNVDIPVYSVARSPIKSEESRHVWYATYASLHKVLNSLDRSVSDCIITMVWYWMIWKNVSNAFTLCKEVKIYDIDESKVLKASHDWFKSSSDYKEIIRDSDIIISSTAHRAIDSEFISNCRDWVLLVSAWSRQNEIDVEYLENNTEEAVITIHEFIKRYLINWKEVFLFRDWKNANFAFKSCPAYSMDLLHSEVLVALENIRKWIYNIWIKELNEVSNEKRNELIKVHEEKWK